MVCVCEGGGGGELDTSMRAAVLLSHGGTNKHSMSFRRGPCVSHVSMMHQQLLLLLKKKKKKKKKK
jgi:hypothetical protein